MNDYEKLRTEETSKELPQEFKIEFEEALLNATFAWKDGAYLVDRFEDDKMELSFAKGFLEGCIYMENKKKKEQEL